MAKVENEWTWGKTTSCKVTIETNEDEFGKLLSYNDILKQCEYAVRGLGYDLDALSVKQEEVKEDE